MKNSLKILGFVFAFLFLIVWQRFYTLQLTMANDRLENDLKERGNMHKRLEFREKDLLSLERLEKYAKDTLNMKYASGKDYAADDN